MLTCKEASFLASKKLDGKLTWREYLAFGMHIAICHMCRRYQRDLNRLRGIIRQAAASGQSLLPTSVQLPQQARERIKQVLLNAAHADD